MGCCCCPWRQIASIKHASSHSSSLCHVLILSLGWCLQHLDPVYLLCPVSAKFQMTIRSSSCNCIPPTSPCDRIQTKRISVSLSLKSQACVVLAPNYCRPMNCV